MTRRFGVRAGYLFIAFFALGASAATPKRVLILNSFGRDVAPYNAVASAFRISLACQLGQSVDLYEAPLDMARFADGGFEAPFADFIEHGYPGVALDLVVPIGAPAASFVVQNRKRLFRNTPILFTAVDSRRIPAEALQTNATVVTQTLDMRGMLEDMLQLQPETTNIVVVFGASPLEKLWVEESRREWQGWTNRVGFTWLDNLSLQQIQERGQKLPPRSFIFFGLYLIDAARVPYDNDVPLKALHASANAPIFGVFKSQFGLGTIGGRLYDEGQVGEQAAKVACRMLHGQRAGAIAPQMNGPSRPEYDWRELKRWGIGPDRLPAGCVVKFRELTLWQRNRWRIVGVTALCFLQTALIVTLVLVGARRRQAQAVATLIADLSSKFINVPPGEVDREVEDAQRRICQVLGLDRSALWQQSTTGPELFKLTHRFGPSVGSAVGEPANALENFPWHVSQLLEGKTIAVSSIRDLPPEAAQDRGLWQELGIKSSVTFPLSTGGRQVFGAVAFETLRTERAWPGEVVKQLQLIAQIFANALARYQAETAMRESEARLSLAAHAAGAGLWSLNLSTSWFWGTDLSRELFGFSRDEGVTFEGFLQKVHPEDLGMVRQKLQEMVESKKEDIIEYRALRPGQGYRWVASRGRVQCGATGQPEYLMGAIADISKRREAMESLKRLQEQNELLLTSTSEGIIGLDSQGNHIFVNPAAARLLGYTAEELLGHQSHSAWHHSKPDESVYPQETCLICAAYHNGMVHRVSTEVFWRKDGTCFPVEYTSTPIRRENQLAGAVVVFADISARKRAEAALHTLSGRLINAQERERTRLAKELHDGLSQNLALLAVELELYGQNPSTRLEDVSKRLLEFSGCAKELSSEVHRLSHDLHPAKLEQLGLAAAIAGFCRGVEAGGLIQVQLIARQVPRVLPEEIALCLYRITQEAVQNVIEHSGAAQVTVELVKANTDMRLLILDEGCGFDPGSKSGAGTLGLIGMRERVLLVSGEIKVESKVGAGTRVFVRVPLPKEAST